MTITLTKPKTQVIWRSSDLGAKTTNIPGSNSSNDGFTLDIKTVLANNDRHYVIPTSGTIGGLSGITFIDTNCNLFLRSDGNNNDWIIRCLCCYIPTEGPPISGTGDAIIDGSSSGYSNYASDYAAGGTLVDNRHNLLGNSVGGQTTTLSNVTLIGFITTIGSPAPSVISITGASLTWQKRDSLNQTVGGFNMSIEEWVTIAPTPLTNETFTATFSSGATDAVFAIQAVGGIDLSLIFDPDSSLPSIVPIENQLVQTDISTVTSRTFGVAFFSHPIGAFLPPSLNDWQQGFQGAAGYGYPGRFGFLGSYLQFNTSLSSETIIPWDFTPAMVDDGMFMVDVLKLA